MYCQYCGKQVEEKEEYCPECGKKLNHNRINHINLKGEKPLFFLCMILAGPVITTIFNMVVFINRWIYNRTDNVFLSFIDLLPLEYLVFLIIIINLAKNGKINTSKFCFYDAVIWTVFWMMQFLVNRLTWGVLIPGMDTYYHILNSAYWSVEHLLLLQDFWLLFCWLCFVVCRNNDTLITFKRVLFLGIGLAIYSAFFFLFGNVIVWEIAYIEGAMADLLLMFKISAIFMGLRYFILFFFVVCLAKKKIGLRSALISIIGFSVIRLGILVFITIYNTTNMLITISDTAGYIYIGMAILITLLIGKDNSFSKEEKKEVIN